MSLLEELETLLETRQPYANGNAEKCYPLVAELIEQLRSAQQSAQADGTCPYCHSKIPGGHYPNCQYVEFFNSPRQ